ncbi:hypothetical protein AXF42_Ash013238 [Apostasia shenzhenica]|uniref:CCT domain-containing protein n=1 Tax=Apostasia shenzhenica TaxID=1088818 RepID=A0A2I0BBE5_9ASPA|nr:hypothetical protein AXF42_Ash013238 [Apostasia shenzhenica]
MLEDIIQSPEQLSIDECISSPIADQLLDFSYDGDFFSDAINTSEVTSSATTNAVAATADVPGAGAGATSATATAPSAASGDKAVDTAALCCYDDAEASFASAYSPFDSTAISALLDSQPAPETEPDILSQAAIASVGQSPAFFPITTVDPLDQILAAAAASASTAGSFTSYSPEPAISQLSMVATAGQALQSTALYDDKLMPTLPGYLGTEPSPLPPCSFLDAVGGIAGGEFYTDGMGVPVCRGDADIGLFAGGMGMYTPASIQRVYSSGDLQVIGDSQHLVARCSSNPTPLPVVASDISTLEDSTYKVGRLSVEERKEKIHRYLKKRNERNFSKKIKVHGGLKRFCCSPLNSFNLTFLNSIWVEVAGLYHNKICNFSLIKFNSYVT